MGALIRNIIGTITLLICLSVLQAGVCATWETVPSTPTDLWDYPYLQKWSNEARDPYQESTVDQPDPGWYRSAKDYPIPEGWPSWVRKMFEEVSGVELGEPYAKLLEWDYGPLNLNTKWMDAKADKERGHIAVNIPQYSHFTYVRLDPIDGSLVDQDFQGHAKIYGMNDDVAYRIHAFDATGYKGTSVTAISDKYVHAFTPLPDNYSGGRMPTMAQKVVEDPNKDLWVSVYQVQPSGAAYQFIDVYSLKAEGDVRSKFRVPMTSSSVIQYESSLIPEPGGDVVVATAPSTFSGPYTQGYVARIAKSGDTKWQTQTGNVSNSLAISRFKQGTYNYYQWGYNTDDALGITGCTVTTTLTLGSGVSCFDDDTATGPSVVVLASSTTPFNVTVDYGPGNEKTIQYTQVITHSDALSGLQVDLGVDYSDDGTTWTNQWTYGVGNLAVGFSTWNSVSEGINSGAHRYWRVNGLLEEKSGFVNPTFSVREIRLYDVKSMVGAGYVYGGIDGRMCKISSLGTPVTWGSTGATYVSSPNTVRDIIISNPYEYGYAYNSDDLFVSEGGSCTTDMTGGCTNVFDGNYLTYASIPFADGVTRYATWDFGSGNTQMVEEFNIIWGSPDIACYVYFTLQGSNDGTSWSVFYDHGWGTNGPHVWPDYVVIYGAITGSYRYFRISTRNHPTNTTDTYIGAFEVFVHISETRTGAYFYTCGQNTTSHKASISAYDSATGVSEGVRRWDAYFNDGYFYGLAQRHDGDTIMAVGSDYVSGTALNTQKGKIGLCSTAGVTIWEKTYPQVSEFYDIAPCEDGGFFLAGTLYSGTSVQSRQAAVMKIDENGNVDTAFPQYFKETTALGADGRGVTETRDGGAILVGGSSDVASTGKPYLIKLDRFYRSCSQGVICE